MRERGDDIHRQILEFAVAGYWHWDVRSGEGFLSPGFKRMLGYEDHEVPNTPESWHQLVVPEDLEQSRDAFRSHVVSRGTVPYQTEARWRRKDGSTAWVLGSAQVIEWDSQGAPLRVLGCNVDITARKQAEEALRDTEARLQRLSDGLPGGMVFQVDAGADWRGGRFNYVSAGVEALHEVSVAEALEEPERVTGQVLPQDREELDRLYALARENLTPFRAEARVRTPSGRLRWVLLSSAPRRAASGHHVWDGVELDITRRKLAEEALRESETRLRLLADNLPGGLVYQVDTGLEGKERRFTYISAGVEALHEVSAAAVLQDASKIYGQLLPEDLQDVARREEIATRAMTVFRAEVRVRMPSGATRWRLFSSAPRRLPNGHVIWDGIEIDITEARRMQEEVMKNQRLESLGLLAGGIAHDFNNLLGGVFGFIELAALMTPDGEVSDYLAKAMAAMDRATGLTQQLLTFARGGSPQRRTDHLFPFVEEVAQFALSGSNVSCRFRVAGDLWLCNYDRGQIGQVIENIVINAQQAMPAGGTVGLCARNVALGEGDHPTLPPGDYVRLSVEDHGIGIPTEYLPRIFDPFFTTKPKGHGLGLATSYSIVHRHGGCIETESTSGKGSAFHIYLPAAPRRTVADRALPEVEHRGSGTFLVMDDEQVIRDTLGEMLTSLGYSVVCKESGQEAVGFVAAEIEARREVAGAILDLTVPGAMGGQEALREIRRVSEEIPVFVTSGYSADPVMANPVQFGFQGSLRKPFRRADLVAMLESHRSSLRGVEG